ncbi:MAG: YceI family protein [Candidatus Hydrogenedentes bacterium]|nr:YceI family protein [Candidatus Hydrogenedentota bacterium]
MIRTSLWISLVAVIFIAGCTPEQAPPNTPTPVTPVPVVTPEPIVEPDPKMDSPAAPVTGQRTFTLQPDSEITWEMAVSGTFGVGTRKGGWAIFNGTIDVENENFETAKIDIEVDMTSAFSDDSALTKKLNGDEHFFTPATFPTSAFKSTAVKKTDTGYDVTGDFTIKGVTKSVTFPAAVVFSGDTLTADAAFDMNRQDYGVNYDSAVGDFVIKDLATMTLKIVAKVE